MKRHHLTFSLLLILSQASLFAQSIPTLADSQRIYQMGRTFDSLYTQRNYDEAKKIGFQVIEETEFYNWLDRKARITVGMGDIFRIEGNYPKAIEYLSYVLNIDTAELPIHQGGRSSAAMNMGNVYYVKGNYDSAAIYYERSLELMNYLESPDRELQGDLNLNLGAVEYSLGNILSAQDKFEKARQILSDIFGDEHVKLTSSYSNLGLILMQTGDYEQAKNYYFRALRIEEKKGPEPVFIKGLIYNNLGLIENEINHFQEAIRYYQQAQFIYEQTLPEDHFYIGQLQNNIGSSYMSQLDYEQAIPFIQKGIQAYERQLGPNHPDLIRLFLNRSFALQNLGMVEESLNSLDRAEAIARKQVSDSNLLWSQIDLSRANFNLKQGHFQATDSLLQLAISRPFGGQQKLNETNWSEVQDRLELLNMTAGVMNTYKELYELSRDTSYLRQAIPILTSSLAAINHMRLHFHLSSSKFALSQAYFSFYEKGMEFYQNLYRHTQHESWAEKAFLLSNQSKALILNDAIYEDKARSFAGIPDSLIKKERIIRIEQGLIASQLEGISSSETKELQEKLFQTNQEFNELIDLFEEKYPAYYQLKYDQAEPKLSDIQSFLLKNKQNLLAYFLGDSLAYGFLLNGDEFTWKELGAIEKLSSTINGLINAQNNFDAKAYQIFAHELYQQWMAPFEEKISSQELLIVPDGPLHQLSFEALVNEPKPKVSSFDQLAFVINRYKIHYIHNPANLLQLSSAQDRGSAKLLSIAPGFTEKVIKLLPSDLNLLLEQPWALATGKRLIDTHGGHGLFEGDASEQNAKEQLSSFGILHFGTHAEMDTLSPMSSRLILLPDGRDSLEDGSLYTYEIYNLQLKAQLAVLNGCETGTGKFARGEGVLSLAKGFNYAGCPSVMMSLWPIDDQQSQKIVESFYQHFYEDQTVGEALWLSKKAYLEESQGDLANPLYWAGMVLVGQPHMKLSQPLALGWWILGILLLASILLLLWRSQKQS
ncbi:MAG: CHAT domain-containing protein [Bacteroidota bacterium]